MDYLKIYTNFIQYKTTTNLTKQKNRYWSTSLIHQTLITTPL